MPDYRRAWMPGATWFFTVNLLERRYADVAASEGFGGVVIGNT